MEGASECTHCGFEFQVDQGIVDFIPGSNFYWGEISQDRMHSINERAATEGNWFKVVNEELHNRQDLIQYFTDLSRLGWLFHGYKEDQHGVCVDIGSGLGSLSFKLAGFFDDVYSVDGVADRLKFQVIRAREEGIHNIHFIRSPLLELPFEDASVDLVVVNGVLEWVGLSEFSKKPDELQRQFLKEIARILKPEGVVYIGIENRFGAQYIYGSKDHSNLPYTSLMPRWLASAVMRYLAHRQRKETNYYFSGFERGYRTYTYSIWGYEKIFKAAGLMHVDANWTWPSYSFPKFSGPLDGDSLRYLLSFFSDRAEKRWMRMLFNLLSRLPGKVMKLLNRLFMPDFLFIASKAPLNHSLSRSLYEKYPEMKSFTRMSLGVNPELNATFYITDKQVKVTRVLQCIERENNPSGRAIVTTQATQVDQGRPLKAHHPRDIQAAVEWLAQFQRQSAQGYWQPVDLGSDISRVIDHAHNLFKGDLADELDQYEFLYNQLLSKVRVPVVSEQGDFRPDNMLIESDGKIKLLSWEQMLEEGNPLMDIGCFSFSLLSGNWNTRYDLFNHMRRNAPLTWFEDGYLQVAPLPVRFAPAYFLLRRLENQPVGAGGDDGQRYILDYWANYLKLAIMYGLSGLQSSQMSVDESQVVYGVHP